jgi:glycosyltransferase involved in cell wall biosynthesis
MKYDISVIIPTYKRPKLIIKTINSLLNQTFKNFQIIVVDDNGLGSIDQIKTKKHVNGLKLQQLSYYSMETNSGAPTARNFGASKAIGKYIAFLDDDDIWDEKKLELQFQCIIKHPNSPLCYSKMLLETKDKLKKFRTWFYFGKCNKRIIMGNYIGSSSNPLVSKRHFNIINGFDVSLPSCQDWDLWYRLIQIGDPIFVNEFLVTINREPIERISTNKLKVLNGHLLFLGKIKEKQKSVSLYKSILFLKISRHFISHF